MGAHDPASHVSGVRQQQLRMLLEFTQITALLCVPAVRQRSRGVSTCRCTGFGTEAD